MLTKEELLHAIATQFGDMIEKGDKPATIRRATLICGKRLGTHDFFSQLGKYYCYPFVRKCLYDGGIFVDLDNYSFKHVEDDVLKLMGRIYTKHHQPKPKFHQKAITQAKSVIWFFPSKHFSLKGNQQKSNSTFLSRVVETLLLLLFFAIPPLIVAAIMFWFFAPKDSYTYNLCLVAYSLWNGAHYWFFRTSLKRFEEIAREMN